MLEARQQSLQSQLRLSFERSGAGTRLSERFHQGLFHLSKPYAEPPCLGLQLVNPTAGLFGGDRLESRIVLGADSNVRLSAPSSTQLYTMDVGQFAESRQLFKLAAGSCLEVDLRWLVPHRDTDYRARTRFELHPEAHLLFTDRLAAGRVAHGEQFAFRRLDLGLDVLAGDEPLLRERFECTGETAAARWRPRDWTRAWLCNLWLYSPALPASGDELERAEALSEEDSCLVGATRLGDHLDNFRLISRDQAKLERILHDIRQMAQEYLPLSTIRTP